MNKEIEQIIEQNYKIGEVLSINLISSGLIHQTYKIKTEIGDFIFQKLHKSLSSSAIAQDFFNVTEHLASVGCTAPRSIRTKADEVTLKMGDEVWRMQTAIIGETFDRISNSEIAWEAGKMLAQFHNALHNFQKPFESDFVLHNTQKELQALEESLESSSSELKTDEVLELGRLILLNAKENLLPIDLPIWVIHGDPKVSNILFADGKAQAIIDLDTCQRSSVLLDLGDAFRSWCREGEGQDSAFSIKLFHDSWRGYRAHAPGLSQVEVGLVLQAIKLITLELSARFLTDYFQDFYFSWDSEKFPSRRAHNLERAKGQFALFKDILKKQAQIDAILSLPV
ncbi:MAG: homoserine kinase [Candidatus Uhrbacteria bacterium GW2011_GWD1_41_16]|uniref:Homoserine kinase n=1 Tax=Candidatus Uhrbacteria bacterium GW2011_GWC1_41_20 TaxID=1618983 RepID=A0A0G0YC03_9BACT|nr:MAG: homoserine kinase [Candidatus Uhrbacteria bacterium GW2011_GWE1_39_46]KKR63375.1 MAG: homoserine kinase [Candidatus Uhrbacteria bacterium GW2011_GWC2_40_450]KKR94830.1 MAG: homoserine kinase [Candidatus Uhrbacteria bacterium GW2011_GWD1_41_16]KKR97862.1 MAG: homoserine kinase [Candidatus Uhrbacteria bacterium GW2011_GWC1_41_20]KKS05576.1 MAG: homoserine kinase [Candidatus Uhrbacteria bacterium GW2011_GWB2_41_36]KKS06674.1 MAG: homoserine kinase [Candidatus Uhrbacteria bacterium GW2011_